MHVGWTEFALIGIGCALTILIFRTVPLFDAGLWPAMIPVIAALIVIPVAIKTKSLVWSIVAGVGSYGLLLLI